MNFEDKGHDEFIDKETQRLADTTRDTARETPAERHLSSDSDKETETEIRRCKPSVKLKNVSGAQTPNIMFFWNPNVVQALGDLEYFDYLGYLVYCAAFLAAHGRLARLN